ncbi:MAG: pyrimidine 5'-nucleotidase [Parasphingopyxis sp.]|uniref:pyrimidine 5'-nucleotidase n=1 Tax=Parasphingopyxis sp. TaxID=1920299 RepID=UPI003FA0000A
MPPALSHIDHWIFDLDNTLYPASVRLFDQIDVKMGDYIARLLDVDRIEARRIQKQFFHSHGTTLSGLMQAHGVEPGDFLDYVHDIDLEVIDEDRALVEAIGALPGRKFVFTNGDAPYARRVLDRLGLGASFEAIHDIHACDYVPKPERISYEAMCRTFEIKPDRALFVEDMARNLKPAKAMGMVTVWVNNGSERGSHEADSGFIDFEIEAVTPWLAGIVEAA